jgi:hypothetical protein
VYGQGAIKSKAGQSKAGAGQEPERAEERITGE